VVVSRTRTCAGTCKVIPICITFKASVESNRFRTFRYSVFFTTSRENGPKTFASIVKKSPLDCTGTQTVLPKMCIARVPVPTFINFTTANQKAPSNAVVHMIQHTSGRLGFIPNTRTVWLPAGEGEDACDRIPRSERSKFEGELIQSRNLDLNWVWSRRIN
jgi:hypothetical protein